MATTKFAVGINKAVVGDDLPAPASYHVVGVVHLDYPNAYYNVTVNSYFSKSFHDKGRPSVRTAAYQIHDAPPRGADINTWVLESLVASPSESNVLAGGEVVYEV